MHTYLILSIISTSSFAMISLTKVFSESNPQFTKILFMISTAVLLFLANKPSLSCRLFNLRRDSLNRDVLYT
jgi:hypothetical protein